MTPQDRMRISLASARYLEALERNDQEMLDALLELAAADGELLNALMQIDEAFLEERQALTIAAATNVVAALARKHLTAGEVVHPPTGPLTVKDVADELFQRPPGPLPASVHLLNERLRSVADALPDNLGLSALAAWAEAKFGPAPAEYWRAFRQAAIKLDLRRAAATEYYLAARSAPKSEGKK